MSFFGSTSFEVAIRNAISIREDSDTIAEICRRVLSDIEKEVMC